MKLESFIRPFLQKKEGKTMEIFAYELWGNRKEGYWVNSGWRIYKGDSIEEALDSIRGRWEIFKVNYYPRAVIKEIDVNIEEDIISFDYNYNSFIEVRFE